MDQPLEPATRRRYPRYKFEVGIRLTRGKSYRPVVFGRGTEVGPGGMAVFAYHKLRVGEIVQIEFPILSSPLPLKVKGAVRNETQFRYGFEFMDLAQAERDQIVQMCEFLSPAD